MATLSNELTKHPLIVVVDDNEDQLTIWRDLLEFHGYAVVTATDGAEALPLVACAALVLTDLRMPVMDGIALVRAVRARPGGGPPVIVVSGDDDRREDALAAGANAFAPKPVRDLFGLVRHIESLIGPSAG